MVCVGDLFLGAIMATTNCLSPSDKDKCGFEDAKQCKASDRKKCIFKYFKDRAAEDKELVEPCVEGSPTSTQ
jgi:hypothetical protein